MFRNYFEARDWLESFIPQTYSRENLGLGRISHLLKLLGNPQEKFKSIHVGGTSGKGSTAYYIARLLQFSGPVSRFPPASAPQPFYIQSNSLQLSRSKKVRVRAVGLHLSPHLVYIGERMQIFSSAVIPAKAGILTRKKILDQVENDYSFIPMKRFIGLVNAIKPVVDEIIRYQPDLTPSYFEILVAASFKYFAEEKVDYAVIEVGLGGKYDATNVLEPEISVITNVGLDHTEILGKTIEKIAEEKAGIIKPKTTIVTSANGKALKVIEKVARLASAPLIVVNSEPRWTKSKNAPLIKINTQIGAKLLESDTLKPPYIYKETLRDTLSPFALSSGLLAIEAVSSLGIRLNRQVVQKAFNKGLEGRFEVIDKGIILDGAHNADKIRFLIRGIKNRSIVYRLRTTAVDSRQWSVVLIIAFKKGKDWKKMIDLLLKNLPVKQVITTKFNNPTDTGFFASVDPEEIAKYIKSVYSLQSTVYSNSQEAVFEALRLHSGSTTILVTGSLYLVGEARTLWHLPKY